MSRKLTSRTTLENLRWEAKRWLKALRAGDADARARFERSHPRAAAEPTLREVQHALAREHGLDGWTTLKREVAAFEASRGDARQLALIELLQAAVRGDADAAAAVLDGHPDIVNERAVIPGHTGHRTALHHAVSHPAVVSALLERGADPNIRDEGDNAYPLHFAAERLDLHVVRMLVEHDADTIGAGDVHELEVIGWATCFDSAPSREGDPGTAEDRRKAIVDYLLAHGAHHTLASAVAMGTVDEIRKLATANPADLDRPLNHVHLRPRPLHLAIARRRPESLAVLLELGADTEAEDAAGLTALDHAALDHAALNGERELAEMLLRHGARLRLPAAAALDRTEDVERLLREEPGALKPGGRYGTLIVRAAVRGSGDLIRALIRGGADVKVHDDTATSGDGTSGFTPLHAAAWNGNMEAARVLLEHGADPNARESKYCGTPAGWADHAGRPEVRDLILAGRIDPFQAIDFELPDRIPDIVQQSPWLLEKPFGEYVTCEPRPDPWWPEPWQTPLVWAVVRNRVHAVRVLLEQGALQRPAPDGRTLVQLAEEAGHAEAAELLRQHRHPDRTPEGRVRWFVKNACPDHDIRGGPAHVIARHTAERLLRRHPEIARDGFYTAVICGDLAEVKRALEERPELADERGGPKGWTPLLYLCFTRLPSHAASNDNAVAIATLLLDHGADPNAYFMAGDSRYTPMVGAIGEGEEDRPAHPRRDELARLLLERGAEPYDIQVLYNIHFHGRALWFLERIHEHALRLGRDADWQDPEWRMLDMGGYGTGARYVLGIAVKRNDLPLADWALSHGANPNSPPEADERFPKISLHEAALRLGHTELAELLVRDGATPATVVQDDEDAFVAACLRLDRERARALVAEHPEYLRSPKAILAAAKQDRADVVAFLLDLGVPIEVEDGHRTRPLHEAAYAGALGVAELLIERGAEIDPRETRWRNTPLDFAVYAQHPRMIDLLAPHSRDIWNLVFTGNVERVREVLAEEPELARVVTKNGQTPLTWLPDDEAAAAEIVRLFLAHGADASVRDRNGLTAADRASRRGLEEAAALLREAEGG